MTDALLILAGLALAIAAALPWLLGYVAQRIITRDFGEPE